MADTVEADRLLLLAKAEAAFQACADEVDGADDAPSAGGGCPEPGASGARAVRILNRLVAQTTHARATLPIGSPPPAPAQADPTSFALPLLAPTLYLGASTSGGAVALPSPTQPPLFLLYHNLGLAHLRARQLKLSQIYLARALESAQTLSACLGAPSASAAAAPGGPRGLAPPRSLASSPSSSNSNSRSIHGTSSVAPSPSASPILSAMNDGTASPTLAGFIHTKQLHVFFHTGLALLRAHSHVPEEDAQVTIDGLQLACRCFRHCVQLSDSGAAPGVAAAPLVAPAAPSAALSADPSSSPPNPFFLHLRLAESLILLDQHTSDARSRSSDPHPLMPLEPASPNEFSLVHAEDPLHRALSLIDSTLATADMQSTSRDATAVVDGAMPIVADLAALRHLCHSASVKLAYVLLALRRPHEALALLAPLLPSSTAAASTPPSAVPTPAALEPVLHFHAEMLTVESLILLNQPTRALNTLRGSSSVEVLEAFSLPPTPPSPAAFASLSPGVLHVVCTRAALALLRRSHDEALFVLEEGLRYAPTSRSLQGLLLLARARTTVHDVRHVLWLLRQPPAHRP